MNTTGTPSSPDVLSTTSGLMMAAMSNQVEVVERLLREESLDVNMVGMQGNTALTFAAGQVRVGGVKVPGRVRKWSGRGCRWSSRGGRC